MSFGFSASDAVLYGELVWKTLQNSRKACGEHDELTREVSSLHVVIRRLEKEASKPESPINRPGDRCKEELQAIVGGCETVLDLLNRVLEKYNTLSEQERSVKKLWQRVRFGNGELANIKDLREKLTYYTSALSLFVNMVSMGSVGRVEQQMEKFGGDIREIKIAVNGITAHLLSANNREGSVLTTYADDDKAVWKEFRKDLIKAGFSSSFIGKHKRLITAYIEELGQRGLLDENPHDIENLSEMTITDNDELGNEVSDANELNITSYKAQLDRAGIEVIILPPYKHAEMVSDNNDHMVIPAGDCLVEQFKARLQILINCVPHTWIFLAREDVDKIRLYLKEPIGFQIDSEVIEFFADSALEILSEFTSWSFRYLARTFLGGLETTIVGGSYLERRQWTELKELMASEWRTASETMLEDYFGIGEWSRRFDTECFASAERMTRAWKKAADLVRSSSYTGMKSLGLIFAKDKVTSESGVERQRKVNHLCHAHLRFLNNYGVVYKGACLKDMNSLTQEAVEEPNRKGISSQNFQDEPYHPDNNDDDDDGADDDDHDDDEDEEEDEDEHDDDEDKEDDVDDNDHDDGDSNDEDDDGKEMMITIVIMTTKTTTTTPSKTYGRYIMSGGSYRLASTSSRCDLTLRLGTSITKGLAGLSLQKLSCA